jgi:hypothetical protein
MLKHLAILVQHHTIIGIGDDTSSRVNSRDGFLHPVQRDQSQQRRTTAALGCPGCGSREMVIFENTRFEPGLYLAVDHRRRLHFGQKGLMVNPIEALRNVQLERLLRPILDRVKDGSDGILTGSSWAKAIGVP